MLFFKVFKHYIEVRASFTNNANTYTKTEKRNIEQIDEQTWKSLNSRRAVEH